MPYMRPYKRFRSRRFGGYSARSRPFSSFRKRVQKKRKYTSSHLVVRNRLITPVMYVKMKYTPMNAGLPATTPYQVLIAQSNNTYGDRFYGGNDTFDPDNSGTGGQPTGHDQWYGFYIKGVVMASKIKVTVLNKSAIGFFKVGVVPSRGNTWSYSTETPSDWPGAKAMVVGPYVGGKNSVSFSQFWRTNTIFGVSKQQVRDDGNYAQPSNASPTFPWYWMIFATPADGTVELATNINVMVEIVYYVRMYDRAELPIST